MFNRPDPQDGFAPHIALEFEEWLDGLDAPLYRDQYFEANQELSAVTVSPVNALACADQS